MSLFSYIKQQVPIMDEVGRYLQLKIAGTYYKGPCPFHRETDASFTVSPDKQIFYCFGCHVSGDVIAFIAKVENLTQIEAAQYLIDQHKLTIPEDIARQAASASKHADEKANYFTLCRVVAEWAAQQLRQHEHAQRYVSSRTINDATIQTFGIGFVPSGARAMQALVKECARNNILVKDLIAAGVLFENRGSSLRSPFEDRIIFPITDALGRHCGFGGRIFVPNDERAKYYNSKESPFFQKGTLLFGYALAKKPAHDKKHIFLVEGYTDVVAMAQHGYQNSVATLGTACTLDHLQLLARSVDIVYVLYDGDSAGHKAMLRVAQLCWQVNIDLRVISLPGGVDPAAYLEKHTDLSEPIAQAQDIFSFFVQATAGDFENKNLAEKMRSAQAILAIIVRISDMVKREILLQEASKALRVPVDALRSALPGAAPAAKKVPAMQREQQSEAKEDEQKTLQSQVVALSINSVLQREQLIVPAEAYEYFSEQSVRILTVRAAVTEKNGTGTQECFEAILAECSAEDRDWIIERTMRYSGSASVEEFMTLVNKVVQQSWKEQVGRMRDEIAQASQKGDSARVQKLVHAFAKLKQQMQQKGLIWQKKQQQS